MKSTHFIVGRRTPSASIRSLFVALPLFSSLVWSQIAVDSRCLTNLEEFGRRWVSNQSTGQTAAFEEGNAATGPLHLVHTHGSAEGWSYWAPREKESARPNRMIDWVSTPVVLTNFEISFLCRTERGARGDGGLLVQCVGYDAAGRTVLNTSSEQVRTEGRWRKQVARFALSPEVSTWEIRFSQKNLAGEGRFARLGVAWQWSPLEPWPIWDFDGASLGDDGVPPWLWVDGKNPIPPKRLVEENAASLPGLFSLNLFPKQAVGLTPAPVSRFGVWRFSFKMASSSAGKLAVGFDFLDTGRNVLRSNQQTMDVLDSEGAWVSREVPVQVSAREAYVRPRLVFDGKGGKAQFSEARLELVQGSTPLRYLQQADGGGNWKAPWIATADGLMGTNGPGRFAFGTSFTAPSNVLRLALQVMADDRARVYLDGQAVAETSQYREVAVAQITQGLASGPHRLTVVVEDNGGLSGLQLEGDLCLRDRDSVKIQTGSNWWSARIPKGTIALSQIEALPRERAVERPPEAASVWDEVPYRLFEEKQTVRIMKISAPSNIRAGEDLVVEAVLADPAEAKTLSCQWEVSGAGFGSRLPSKNIAGGSTSLFFSNRVPPLLEAGEIRLELRVPGRRIEGPSSVLVQVIQTEKPRGFAKQGLVKVRGQMQFVRNGVTEPFAPVYQSEYDRRATGSLAAGGFDTFVLDAGDMGWKGEGRFDGRELFDQIRNILWSCPGARIVLQVPLDTATWHGWWVEKYPDSLARTEAGQGIYASFRGRSNFAPSFSSPRYRRDFGEALRRMIQAVGAAPWAEQVMMVRLLSGAGQQWFHWGSPQEILSDYNPAHRDGFRAYLRQIYRGQAGALAAAWGRPGLDFDRVEIPKASARTHGGPGLFRTAPADQEQIDYDAFHQRVPIETLEHFARVVKEASGGRLLTAAPYGWQMSFPQTFQAHQGGQGNLRLALKSPFLDVFTGPAMDRAALGAGGFPVPQASFAPWGKAFLQQFDLRTFWKAAPSRTPVELSDDLELLRREVSMAMAWGTAVGWEEGSGHELSGDPRLAREIRALSTFLPKLTAGVEPLEGQVTVYVDDAWSTRSSFAEPHGLLPTVFQIQVRALLQRSGVRIDVRTLADLEHPAFESTSRVHLFVNTFAIQSNHREVIRKRLMKPGHALVYLHGAGLFGGDGMPPRVENMADLTGIALAQGSGALPFITRRLGAETGLLPERSGNGRSNAPYFHVTDPKATVLGVYADRTNEVSVACKDVGGTLVYYMGTPSLSPSVLRGICRKAGVFIYTETEDGLYPTTGRVGLFTRSSGPREIFMPEGNEAVEIWSGVKYPIVRGRLSFDAEARTSYLFVAGPDGPVLAEAWRNALGK